MKIEKKESDKYILTDSPFYYYLLVYSVVAIMTIIGIMSIIKEDKQGIIAAAVCLVIGLIVSIFLKQVEFIFDRQNEIVSWKFKRILIGEESGKSKFDEIEDVIITSSNTGKGNIGYLIYLKKKSGKSIQISNKLIGKEEADKIKNEISEMLKK